MTTKAQITAMKKAAYRLAMDRVLFDPSDDEILLAAAESAPNCESVDLLALSDSERLEIIDAYDH